MLLLNTLLNLKKNCCSLINFELVISEKEKKKKTYVKLQYITIICVAIYTV